MTEKKVGLGILAGISTGVFWGLPFLVPQMLENYSSVEISFGRFFFFGLVSLFFLKKVIGVIRRLSMRDRAMLFCLSASGFWLYSLLLCWGVQSTDGIISSLIVGMLPITIPLFSPSRRIGGSRFYVGLLLLLIGIVNLFASPIFLGMSLVKTPSLMGVLALVGCLILWTWFAIQNTSFLQRNPQVDRKDFASVVGLVSLVSVSPFFLLHANFSELIHREGFNTFLVLSFLLGVGSSWFANWLWNVCSYHCPAEVSGPLMVSEALFGLLYSFIYEARTPRLYEAISIVLFLFGAFLTVNSQIQYRESNKHSI